METILAALGGAAQGGAAASAQGAQANSMQQLAQLLGNPRGQPGQIANPFGSGGVTGAQPPMGPMAGGPQISQLGQLLAGR